MENNMIIFDFDQSFFSSNSSMRLFWPKPDKQSKEEEKLESIYMWCIAMSGAPNSPISNFTDAEKQIELNNYIIREFPLNKSSKTPFIFDMSEDNTIKDIDKMLDITTPLAKKMMARWEKRMKEREKFIDNTPYSETTYEMLEKLNDKTIKFWQDYNRIKKIVDEESEENIQGGGELSFNEEFG